VFSREKESIPYWNKFLQGYYDSSAIPSDTFDQAVRVAVGGDVALTPEMADKGIQLRTSVDTTILYLGVNWLDATVGGDGERARKLRRALAIAVDWEEYISIFLNGRGWVAHDPLAPGIFGQRAGDLIHDVRNARGWQRGWTETSCRRTARSRCSWAATSGTRSPRASRRCRAAGSG